MAAVCAALLVATSSSIPIVWDEGDTIYRAEQILREVEKPRNDADPSFVQAISSTANWPYTTVREGHPPLSGILVAIGLQAAPRWLDPLTRARLAPMLLFSVGVGAMFYRLQREYGVWAVSVMAVAALLTMPRVFAHAHFATLDGPVTACWMLAWALFAPACHDWRMIAAFGVALGLALSAKFTGWLAPLPFLAWVVLYRDLRGLRALTLGAAIAVAVFVALNPPLWHAPVEGLRTFLDLNLGRASRPGLNITTQFFGQMYDLDHPLPWYNTLVWTVITISPVPLLIGCIGLVASLRRWRSDRAAILIICQWATLVIVRALPLSPPHDAERLILPSFAFFAALIGVGIGRALYRDSLLLPEKIVAQGWAKVAMAIALVAPTVDSILYFPHGLSFYSRLIGGLQGASRLGMEPTYYWDALDRQTLEWLAENTADDEKVAFGAAPPKNLALLQRWGRLKHLPDDPGSFRWYVIQRRPSAWSTADRWLIANEQPAFQRTLSGIPLLDVYSFDQYQRAGQSR